MKDDKTTIEFFKVDNSSELKIPFIGSPIIAGFPSPATDYLDDEIDLNNELIKHPASTFCGRVKGLSMIDAEINNGDIIIVDKSLEPRNNDIAVCFLDGEFTLKRIQIRKDEVILLPANSEFKPIRVTEENDFLIWGIVTYVIKPKR